MALLYASMSGQYLLKLEGILPTCACIAFGTAFLGLFASAIWSWPADDSVAKPAATLDEKRLRPAVLVTVGWSALYFCFLQGQAAAAFWVHKMRREASSKKDDPKPREHKPLEFADVKYGPARSNAGLILTMDRSVGNMLEQTPPFLLGLWLYALVVSVEGAARLGWVWLLLRASYPLAFANPSMTPALWGVQRRVGISWVSFVTWPSYAIVWTLLVGAAKACW